MQQSIPWEKIESLEREIKALKALGKVKPKNKQPMKLKKNPLKGILEGIHFSEEDIQEAKKAIFDFKDIK